MSVSAAEPQSPTRQGEVSLSFTIRLQAQRQQREWEKDREKEREGKKDTQIGKADRLWWMKSCRYVCHALIRLWVHSLASSVVWCLPSWYTTPPPSLSLFLNDYSSRMYNNHRMCVRAWVCVFVCVCWHPRLSLSICVGVYYSVGLKEQPWL